MPLPDPEFVTHDAPPPPPHIETPTMVQLPGTVQELEEVKLRAALPNTFVATLKISVMIKTKRAMGTVRDALKDAR
jgi:hypothetical protein